MARPSSHPFDLLVRRFADVIAERLSALTPTGGSAKPVGVRRGGANRGRKLDMRCRYPGCKNKSKGPRFRFLCEEHLKLPKSAQKAALEKWTLKNA